MRKKILQVITWLNPGGIEKWLLSLLHHVPASAYQIDFCCKGPETGDLAVEALSKGSNVIHCQLRPSHLGFIQGLSRLVKEYDLIHNHLESYSGVPVAIARRSDKPVITSFHNVRFQAQSFMRYPLLRQLRGVYSIASVKYALSRSSYVTGCSEAVLRNLDSRYREKDRFRLLYYGVAPMVTSDPDDRARFRSQFSWTRETPVLLHVGRFFEQKNHKGLIRIYDLVREELPQTKLLLIGDGPLRPDIEREVRSRGLEDSVRFLGVVNQATKVMQRVDLFVFPSLFEGFGLVLLEANAAHLPLVAYRISGVTEAVSDGSSGILLEPGDEKGMARSITQILTDESRRMQLIEGGRHWVQEKFSPKSSAEAVMDLYDECLSDFGRNTRG